ncbi:MAG: isoprenylcysteine carboxylmethyltransferase family protein [Alphaproteobacteria bacterium]|nr:isoprenylcysteine carboxylmethyltransferase family protein [Alphaproteobacteria bacterium]
MTRGLFAKAVMAAAVVLAVVGIGLVAVPLGWFVDFHWPLALVLAWDAALSLLFFTQHSAMVRPRVRAAMPVPEHYRSALYAMASGAVLILVLVLWQRAAPFYALTGAPRLVARLIELGAVAVLAWGAVALRQFDLCGLKPIQAHLRGERVRPMPFVVRGPYRWVRHPLYAAILVLMWTYPDVTLDHLLFDLLWTAWIVAASHWEETDLVRAFGADYQRYQRRVPMLLPWRRPAAI